MAIYSLRMSAIGKTTQGKPFTAAAHVKYITRKEAVTQVLAARMPATRRAALTWLRREEREDRANARIIDKLVLALPKELSASQQHALVQNFAEALTQGRASWLAAFHTRGKDASNPHCHLILRDRDVVTKRRVMFLSAGLKEAAHRRAKGQAAPTTLTAVREAWERQVNAALAAAGRVERVDRRSLKDQGSGRAPTVHEGPNIRAMHKRGACPLSKTRLVRVRRRGRVTTREVRYAEIDRGVTRVEHNARLRAAAKPPAAKTPFIWSLNTTALTIPTPPARPVEPVLERLAGGGSAPPPKTLPAPIPEPPPAKPQTLTQQFAKAKGIQLAQPRGEPARGRGR